MTRRWELKGLSASNLPSWIEVRLSASGHFYVSSALKDVWTKSSHTTWQEFEDFAAQHNYGEVPVPGRMAPMARPGSNRQVLVGRTLELEKKAVLRAFVGQITYPGNKNPKTQYKQVAAYDGKIYFRWSNTGIFNEVFRISSKKDWPEVESQMRFMKFNEVKLWIPITLTCRLVHL